MFLNDPRDDREAKPNSPYRVEKRIEEPLLHLGEKPGPLSSTSMMTTSRVLPRSAIRLSSARSFTAPARLRTARGSVWLLELDRLYDATRG